VLTNFISLVEKGAFDRLNCTLKFNNQNKWRADGGALKRLFMPLIAAGPF